MPSSPGTRVTGRLPATDPEPIPNTLWANMSRVLVASDCSTGMRVARGPYSIERKAFARHSQEHRKEDAAHHIKSSPTSVSPSFSCSFPLNMASTLMRALAILSLAVSSALASLPTTTIYQSPAMLPFENIAVRASGQLLLTSVYSPVLYSLDASSGTLTEVITVGGGATSLLGISEFSADNFAVVAAEFNATTDTEVGGTVAIWHVASLPSFVIGANGLSAIFGSNTVFVADSGSGTIFIIDMSSGAVAVGVQAAALEPVGQLLGVNGLKVSESTVYFTNSAQGTFGSIQILPSSSGPTLNASSITTLGTLEDGAPSAQHLFDDLAVDTEGRAWVAVHPGSISLFTPNDDEADWIQTDAIVGDTDDYNVFVVPTSCAFGRTPSDATTLYVTTDGGQVVAVDTSGV
uniref:SMP-30/Gluconolactonase/LRE-like region domain-containing protein n=1 Tax=Mycena chlorophos TaxID=658473 RepID=A0ABQ0LJ78_MYCCL|nr:predicted protein [Mycena chlorophos]